MAVDRRSGVLAAVACAPLVLVHLRCPLCAQVVVCTVRSGSKARWRPKPGPGSSVSAHCRETNWVVS
jgi:hypothetical protein